ncbi:hypothetical protein C4D60_Mb09t11770 [Musa balbisiana]|uniref:Uncharacterized protein n=1 Tax=Musa balbisiana TaxID=52838 RepID=A0A4S8IFT7_MUSBA|nr:hypothetical protein C4D60_Mb09t11770 [Musa balbisiana]
MGRVASVAMVTVMITLVVMMFSMVVHMMILAQVPDLVECIVVGEAMAVVLVIITRVLADGPPTFD